MESKKSTLDTRKEKIEEIFLQSSKNMYIFVSVVFTIVSAIELIKECITGEVMKNIPALEIPRYTLFPPAMLFPLIFIYFIRKITTKRASDLTYVLLMFSIDFIIMLLYIPLGMRHSYEDVDLQTRLMMFF